ncbi:MAG: dihydroorotate dehydrogenase-like protein [Zetaproteobacteria bacterium]|nr:MAG: dihydroorotate dehydrogenase-like protein [Zetaproteobacteria bacterium]
MTDLSTSYLGLTLKNPLVVSPSPLCQDVGSIRQMEDAGASAVVLHSLFEEQLTIESQELDHFLTHGTDSFAEALSYYPDLGGYKLGPDAYLEHIRKAKAAVKIPVIASLNGVSTGGWIRYAKKMEDAGADGLELNVYYIATDPDMSGAQVEQMYADLVRDVRASIKIPVAVKLGPYFSAMASMARRLDQAGANGLVLFNRFYQPDFDLEKLAVTPNLVLSRSDELRLRLTWVGILYGRIKADMAITGGVHTPEDVIKSMMAGARVAMMTSALLRNGVAHIGTVLQGMQAWMEEHEYASVRQMQGSMSQKSVAEPAAFERANYMKVLSSYAMK